MNRYKREIMNRASRNLTNRADGNMQVDLVQADPNVSDGLGKFFGFTITNGAASPVATAIFPANFDTERYVINDGAVIKTYDNITALNNAGYNVGAVLCDGTTQATINGKTVNMTCASNDPMRTIKQLLDFVKLNPQKLKHMDIISSTENMWSGYLTITFCNPFYKGKETTVQLNTYFSRFQYQDGRIGIDWTDGNELTVSDLSLLISTIPAEATVQFLLTFE